MAAVLASDEDSEANGEVTYSLDEDEEDSAFFLNSVTGVFNVSRPLDFEVQQFYVLMARAEDGGRQASSVRVYFNILDVNDNPPVFGSAGYSVSVAEDLPVGSSVVSLMASDADDGMTAAIWGSYRGLLCICEVTLTRGTIAQDRYYTVV